MTNQPYIHLADIRAQIDALDETLNNLLDQRMQLVAQVSHAKEQADDDGFSPVRPMREAIQLQTLMNWHKTNKPLISQASLYAIWRELVSAAIAHQGGVNIYAEPAAQIAARNYFGAALKRNICEADAAIERARQDKKSLVVLAAPSLQTLNSDKAAHIFTRLAGDFYIFGHVAPEPEALPLTHLFRKDDKLIETDKDNLPDGSWLGCYPMIMGGDDA